LSVDGHLSTSDNSRMLLVRSFFEQHHRYGIFAIYSTFMMSIGNNFVTAGGRTLRSKSLRRLYYVGLDFNHVDL